MSRIKTQILVNSLLIIVLLFSSCNNDNYINLKSIKTESQFQRFDKAFFTIDTANFKEGLDKVKEDFPPFFMQNQTLSFWQNQQRDELQQELFIKSQNVFGDMQRENEILNTAIKRYYFYFGEKPKITFYAYISRLDFGYPIIYADSLCFAALDMYLGSNSKYYQNLPNYLAYYRQARFLVRDITQVILESKLSRKQEGESLLDAMVYYGKLLYITERLIPQIPEHDLLKYPEEKLKFAKEKEKEMWVYFVENQLLFKSDIEAIRNFIDPAPFSKFRTKLDNKTPGQIGIWYGYNIVKAYAEQTEIDLEQLLLESDSQKILKLSNYKP